jgi:peptidoglycan/LPS O-acetylase OafA/YrhL
MLKPASRIENKVFFPNLDGLRFIAFLLVFISHSFGGLLRSDLHSSLPRRLAGLLFRGGGIGVSFFFVLSGFLITYLIIREVNISGKIDILSFYKRRILRIWPLYYLSLTFAFILYPALKLAGGYSPYIEKGNLAYYVLFLSNFDVINLGIGRGAVSTNITWSVSVEEQFYLLWPLFFLIQPQYYKFIFPAAITASAIFRFFHADNGMILYFHTFSVITDMVLGGLLAYLCIHKSALLSAIVSLKKTSIIAVYLVGTLGLAYQDALFTSHAGLSAVFTRLFSAMFFAFIIFEQNHAEHSLIKMKDLALISNLGKYTYGLYLLHPIALLLVIAVAKMLHLDRENRIVILTTGLIAFGVSLIMSLVSYHWYEKPFLNLKERLSRVST